MSDHFDFVQDQLRGLLSSVDSQDELIDVINELRGTIGEYSPFKDQPVDNIQWIKNDRVHANAWNPNKVAPPEMELLRISIDHDGFTQPIVGMDSGEGNREVVDGYHRSRVGTENADIRERVHGYLPIVTIRKSQEDKNDRIASTIRHNRARGKHEISAMQDIVVELKRRNWSDERVAKELGMDADEVLRLCQLTGITELFSDSDFSRAWEVAGDVDGFTELREEDIR